jgi:hypothetical protein
MAFQQQILKTVEWYVKAIIKGAAEYLEDSFRDLFQVTISPLAWNGPGDISTIY